MPVRSERPDLETPAGRELRREAARAASNNELLERRLLDRANAIDFAAALERRAADIRAARARER